MTPSRRPVPRMALSQKEAAESLGVSPNFFRVEIAPRLKTVRLQSRRLYPISELQRFLEDNAELTLDATP
jgi:hypothetical protein